MDLNTFILILAVIVGGWRISMAQKARREGKDKEYRNNLIWAGICAVAVVLNIA